ncbi:hypothetical protein [Paenibacillus sp. JDR-2]|uniref:hypothetical protein n=1 Tax=Paenibacillus sp. (strain JDR-2) TaxID=324057 RepID=UPI000166A45A|nr:hypothetical protein [Paenibacillus sp. JDR-2]ACT00241.1 hypothetical protein Pjdr2_1569 [Paenibacillus sp. JDR-2]
MKFCLTEAGMCEIVPLPHNYSCNQINHIERFLEKVKAGARIIVEHIDRHKVIYRIGAMTLVLLIGLDVTAFAADASIDANAGKLYHKLIGIGKWVVLIKGAFDTISSTVQGDFVQARKSGLAYLLVYVILLGLPWAFNQVEVLFEEVT